MTAPAKRIGGSSKLINAQQLAELLGVSKNTIYHQWGEWGLKAYKVGRNLAANSRGSVRVVAPYAVPVACQATSAHVQHGTACYQKNKPNYSVSTGSPRFPARSAFIP